jgi:hypothetical protein
MNSGANRKFPAYSPIVSPIGREIGSVFGGFRKCVGRDGNDA